MAVLALDGVVLGDLAAPCEVFGRARDRRGGARYEVRVCSPRAQVRSQHLRLRTAWGLEALDGADTVVVPGVDPLGAVLDRPIDRRVLDAIRRAAGRGARVASICTGAFVLAATGLLDGRRATTHWRAAGELARRHPTIHVDPGVLYVDGGRVLTSAGAAAGLDLCLHLVRCDLGAAAAVEVARMAVMPLERAGGQAQFIVHPAAPPGDDALAPLLSWIELNLKRDLGLAALARRSAMSPRTFCRRFAERVGTTPARWVARARVRHAQRLLETTGLAVERVAEEVGFRSATVLRQRFGELVGTSPLAYRRSFRAGQS